MDGGGHVYDDIVLRWTTCNATVTAFVKEYLEPLISDLLPQGIGEWVECGGLH